MRRKRAWLVVAIFLGLLSGPACALGGLAERIGFPLARDAAAPTLPLLYPTLTPSPIGATPDPTDPRAFQLELTEAELAAFFGENGFAQQGLSIRNLAMVITEQHVTATADAAHAGWGLNGELSVVGLPHVVDGALYIRIVDYSLGPGFSGWARLVASALARATISSLNAERGIPIPVGGIAEITAVELRPGRLVISGRLP